jgi:hypothetical protein
VGVNGLLISGIGDLFLRRKFGVDGRLRRSGRESLGTFNNKLVRLELEKCFGSIPMIARDVNSSLSRYV